MKNPLPLLLLAFLSLDTGAQNVIYFDEPTSLSGRACWFGGHPERYDQAHKPIDAGSFNANADPEWESRSLPLGNGSIGCNVMGSVATERYTLNEKTLWRGGPHTALGPEDYWAQNKEAAPFLPEIRQAFLDGDLEKAQWLTCSNFNSPVPYEATGEKQFRFGSFTTLGELCIETGISEEGISNYIRALSLDSAYALVSLTDSQGVVYERRTFVSYPANVMAIRFTSSQKKRQNLAIEYTPNPLSEGSFEDTGKGSMKFVGRLDNNAMEFVVRMQVFASQGECSYHEGKLFVQEADTVTILLTADTDYAPNFDPDFADPLAYVGVKPQETTAQWLQEAAQEGFDALFETHYADFSALFNRVSFSLEGPSSHKPTDERLEDYRNGTPDLALETLYYQFGRYLLIASSREGNLPANLQGIWHNNVDGPWRVDYHNNINLQMNYWPALSTGLEECARPLTTYIRLLEAPGKRTAKAYWGAEGWAAGISSNIFGYTAPLEGMDMTWNYNPVASSWLATHLWEYYDFTRDKNFLRETAYPLMRGCAKFCQDFLWRKPDGTLTAAPSTSPEHGSVDEGTTFTHAVVREILSDCIAAAHILQTDQDLTLEWEKLLEELFPYRVGRYGQLLEWSQDIDDPRDEHRHVNHLFGLHPGSSISPEETPELAQACRVVLEHRGDGATGWSMGWKLNLWARLHDGNHAYLLFGNLLKNGTADNLWDIHPPFQIDGNFGGTAGVTEMLLQSHTGSIHLLPALPDAWPKGWIRGLKARGNFTVDIFWQNGALQRADILSGSGQACQVTYHNQTLSFPTQQGKTYSILFSEGKIHLL